MAKHDKVGIYALIISLRTYILHLMKKKKTTKSKMAGERPHTLFFALNKEFKEKCTKINKFGIEFVNFGRDLAKLQSQIRESYEKTEQESRLAVENYKMLILRLLRILDDLEQKPREVSTHDFIKYINTSIKEAIRREGVELMRVGIGKIFDPRIHTPSRKVLNKKLPERTIVEILTPGYLLDSKLLRKAEVAISYEEEER